MFGLQLQPNKNGHVAVTNLFDRRKDGLLPFARGGVP